MRHLEHLTDLQPLVGQHLADRPRIDRVAEATGDPPSIHTDPQRAAEPIARRFV